MIFVFKLLFAFLGFRIAGFFGYSILYGTGIGLVVGHVADSVALVKMQKYKAKKYWEKHARAQYNNTFFNSFFLLLGKICLADGLINKEEIQAVEKICDEVLKIKRSEKKAALKIFKEALKSPSSVQYDAAQFYEIHKTQPQTLENMVVFLFQVSASDGHISPLEESLIKTVAQIFNLPEQRYLDIASN
nr:TerB family tellurite resistance protein [Pseudomonadota bacterium]